MKKVLAILLLLAIMLTLFSGCNESPEPNNDPETPSVSPENTRFDAPNLSGYTITILSENTWVSGVDLKDILPRFQQIEELTGCTLVWETAPGGGDYATVVQTRLTGDPSECPDIIMMPTDTGTFAKYIKDDILFDFTSAYDVCPNIKAFYEEYRPDLKGSFTYLDGGIYNLLSNTWRYAEDQRNWVAVDGDNAIWYRGDIAAELGWDHYPSTIEELHDLLLAVKNAYPNMVPMHMWNWDGWESVKIFNSAYGLHYNNDACMSFFYPDENGKLQYEPALQATKEWLTEMQKWYKEGLIVIGGSEDAKIGAAASGITFSGFYSGVTTLCEPILKQTQPDAYFMYMPFPTKQGYQTTLMPRPAYDKSAVVINNGDEDQCRAAAQFLDFAFLSDYGIYSEQAGVEGEGWSFGEDGSFVPNEEYIASIQKKEAVLQASGANIHFNGPSTKLYDVSLAWKEATEKVRDDLGLPKEMTPEQLANWKEINEINSSFYQTLMPSMYMSSEDLAQLNAWGTDLGTFTSEMLEKYILGTADLNAFDYEFVDVLYNRMHLAEITEITQKYYDMYLANAGQ